MNQPMLAARPIAAPVHRFTIADYRRLAGAGIIHEDARVELIEGEIYDMAPIGAVHAFCVNRLAKLLTRVVADEITVSIQNPLQIPPDSEPVPDLMLLRPRADGYCGHLPQPADVMLLIEVADTTIARDRGKLAIYARAAIPEAWIVDVARRTVIVCRNRFADGYRSITEAADSVSPLALPDVQLSVPMLFG